MAQINEAGLIKLDDSEKQSLRKGLARTQDLKRLIGQAKSAGLDEVLNIPDIEERVRKREREIKGMLLVYGDETV